MNESLHYDSYLHNSGGAVVQVFSAAVSPFACTNSKVIVTLRPHGLMAP